MAENNSELVSAAKPIATGAISSAKLGTALPTDATSGLNAAFVRLGYVAEGGLTKSVSKDQKKIKAWGGATVLVVSEGREETWKYGFLQSLDPDVLREVYGAENVVVSDEGAIKIVNNGRDLPRRSFVFEMLLTGGRVKRVVVPIGQLGDIEDIEHKDGDPTVIGVTLTCFPDAQGNTSYEYISAPAG